MTNWEVQAAPFASRRQVELLEDGWEPFAGMPMSAARADGTDMGAVPTLLFRRRRNPVAVGIDDLRRLRGPDGVGA